MAHVKAIFDGSKRHGRLRTQWEKAAEADSNEKPISTAKLALEIWKKIKGTDWVLVNGSTEGWIRKIWDFTKPGQYLGTSGGGGLGYGIGASLGAALALKDTGKLCVSIESDGDLLYASSALWTAAHHQIPLLTIMFNNRCYYNSAEHVINVSNEREREPGTYHIGTRIEDPVVDFAAMARSFGVYADGPIESPEKIGPALARAIKVVTEDKKPALVDIVCRDR